MLTAKEIIRANRLAFACNPEPSPLVENIRRKADEQTGKTSEAVTLVLENDDIEIRKD